jgi:hypothetical protein
MRAGEWVGIAEPGALSVTRLDWSAPVGKRREMSLMFMAVHRLRDQNLGSALARGAANEAPLLRQ